MDSADILPYLSVLAVPLLGWLSARATLKQAERAQQGTSAIDFAANVVLRVQKLEENVEALNKELQSAQDLSRVSFSYIERLLTYVIAHFEPADPDIPPVPVKLAEYIAVVVPVRESNNDDST